MKLKGIFGKGSGKLGNAVFAVSGGEQLVKEYNPKVSNPNTDAQVEQRAKFKLLSQLAADLSPILGFKKNGLISARNQFVTENYKNVTYSDGRAYAIIDQIVVAKGKNWIENMPQGTVTATEVQATVTISSGAQIAAVVYGAFSMDEVNRLHVEDVKIVTTPGTNNTFPVALKNGGKDVRVWAFGIVDSGNGSKINYTEYEVESLDDRASLDAVKSILRSASETTNSATQMYEVG